MTKLERFIVRSAPFAFLSRKSKTWIIPGFRGLPLYDVVKFFFGQINKVGLNERAAAISFNLIMALPAGLIFLFSLIPYLPLSAKFQGQLLRLMRDISPTSETAKFIVPVINDLFKKQLGVFSFGFVLVLFYASNAMIGVIRTFDKSIKEHKGFFLHKRWRAIRLTTILILVLIASVLILLGQQQLKGLFSIKRGTNLAWWNGVRWCVIVCLLFYSIAFIYKFAPSVKKRWSLVSPGSLLATSLMMITAILFSYWVTNFASYNKVYGSIGTVLIIMLLVYINSLILIIGFELNVSITYLTREAEERKLKERAI
ncbi:MAG: YihY/virulence factor BrkB family protein [Sediminibacterium sp.]